MTGVCWTVTAALTWMEDRGLEDCGLRGGVACLSVYVSLDICYLLQALRRRP